MIRLETLQVAVATIVILTPLFTFIASYFASKKMLEAGVNMNAQKLAELRVMVDAMDDDKVDNKLCYQISTEIRSDIKELKETSSMTRDSVIRLETSHQNLAARIEEYFADA